MLDMSFFTSQIKLGPLSVAAACMDGQLWFLLQQALDALKMKGIPLELVDQIAEPKDQTQSGDSTSDDITEFTFDGLLLSEEGFYACLMKSDASAALPFQNWISQCVLPAILLDRYYYIGEERGATELHRRRARSDRV